MTRGCVYGGGGVCRTHNEYICCPEKFELPPRTSVEGVGGHDLRAASAPWIEN